MKIVLKHDVVNLGEEGDIKVVADGYARNFLIPKGFAVLYSKAALNELDKRRHHIEKRKEDKRKEAMSYKQKLEAEEIVISMPAGDKGKLFGAVTAATIADELGKKGMTVEKKKIDMPEHSLKMVGNYTVKVKLYGNEVANLRVVIQAMSNDAAQ
jgi:large subunit ribosomal protein L9